MRTCSGVVEGAVPGPPSVHERLSGLFFVLVVAVGVVQRVASQDHQHVLQVCLGTPMAPSVPNLGGRAQFLGDLKAPSERRSFSQVGSTPPSTHLPVDTLHRLGAAGAGLKQSVLQQRVGDVVQGEQTKTGQAEEFG